MGHGLVDVREAAQRLGVTPSRIRQVLAEGQLAGQRLGGVWLIDEADLATFAQRRAPAGRTLAPHSAWAVLAYLEGTTPPASPITRVPPGRIESYATSDPGDLVPRLRRRAEPVTIHVGPEALARLSSDDRLVRSGAAVAGRQPAADEPALEAYCRASHLSDVLPSQPGPGTLGPGVDEEHRVVLHVVPDECWPFSPETTSVWARVALLDAYDRGATSPDAVAARWLGAAATAGRRPPG